MSIVYFERRRILAAVQWSGSNQAEIEEFMESMGLTSVSSTVDGTDLVLTFANNGPGTTFTVSESGWVVQSNSASTSTVEPNSDVSLHHNFIQVYP